MGAVALIAPLGDSIGESARGRDRDRRRFGGRLRFLLREPRDVVTLGVHDDHIDGPLDHDAAFNQHDQADDVIEFTRSTVHDDTNALASVKREAGRAVMNGVSAPS